MYRNPIPTVDAVIFLNLSDIVLVKRKNPPHGHALPGGFVNEGESFEDAVIREAKEETGLKIEILKQFRTYSDPKRDPRGHHVSTVFIARAFGQTPVAADDAAGILVGSIKDIVTREDLAFDHQQILEDVLAERNQLGIL